MAVFCKGGFCTDCLSLSFQWDAFGKMVMQRLIHKQDNVTEEKQCHIFQRGPKYVFVLSNKEIKQNPSNCLLNV